MGAYDRFGNWHSDPAWMQTDDADDIAYDDILTTCRECEQTFVDDGYAICEECRTPVLDDHDRRYDDYYSEHNGDIGDDALDTPF